MIPVPKKRSQLETVLDGLSRRQWITAQVAAEIANAKDKVATLERLVKAGSVSMPVGRTILRAAEAETGKNATYGSVIDKHVDRIQTSPKEETRP